MRAFIGKINYIADIITGIISLFSISYILYINFTADYKERNDVMN
jgi:hypothetical protein